MNNSKAQTRVDQAGLDQDEIALLEMMRYLFRTYASPMEQEWMRCVQLAHTYFAGAHEAEILNNVIWVVDAMRCSRQSGFRFSNPNCSNCAQYLCSDERLLVGTLSAVRRGQKSLAHANALLLCEGNDPVHFLEVTGRLGRNIARFRAPFSEKCAPNQTHGPEIQNRLS